MDSLNRLLASINMNVRMVIFIFYSGQFRERTRLDSDRGATLLCLRVGQRYGPFDWKHDRAFEASFAVQQWNSG